MVLGICVAKQSKQQGIDVVMEGCLHDIVRFVAGGEHPPRELVGEVTGVKNRYGIPSASNGWTRTKTMMTDLEETNLCLFGQIRE